MSNDCGQADNEQTSKDPAGGLPMPRRKFIKDAAATAAAFTIVPSFVLGGPNHTAPSDKITLAYIGVGTEGLRELLPLLSNDQFQVTAVCDPNKDALGYKDWSKEGLRDEIRTAIKNPAWTPGGDNAIPGGRENGKSVVDSFYASNRPAQQYKGCRAYADFRELFQKESDLDAVKIMTPDHLHGVISMAAIKKGKHVLLHKPISNRLMEGKKVIDLATNSKVITHLIPWDSNLPMDTVMGWINSGAIGDLTEVHNWSNRPVWPQFPTLPEDRPASPPGFDWDLWLGPEADRPYHPNYTHMVFRGWYDFGGGSMADMGHYSLWSVFNALQLKSPTIIEPNRSHVCGMHDPVPYRIKNDFSFPMASSVRFKYPANGSRPALDLCWYDGGMRPPIPHELLDNNNELPQEGMMFVGSKGKILGGFHGENAVLLKGDKPGMPGEEKDDRQSREKKIAEALQLFVDACKSGKQYPGSFMEAEHITEAVNLYAVALRTGSLLKYDASNSRITNIPEANKYLSREYRPGWDPGSM